MSVWLSIIGAGGPNPCPSPREPQVFARQDGVPAGRCPRRHRKPRGFRRPKPPGAFTDHCRRVLEARIVASACIAAYAGKRPCRLPGRPPPVSPSEPRAVRAAGAGGTEQHGDRVGSRVVNQPQILRGRSGQTFQRQRKHLLICQRRRRHDPIRPKYANFTLAVRLQLPVRRRGFYRGFYRGFFCAETSSSVQVMLISIRDGSGLTTSPRCPGEP